VRFALIPKGDGSDVIGKGPIAAVGPPAQRLDRNLQVFVKVDRGLPFSGAIPDSSSEKRFHQEGTHETPTFYAL
jgi:hypothetical protein